MSTIVNPPAQAAISYRARTYATSLAAMQANLRAFAIPGGPNAGTRPLARLTTRASDDPTIAFLDAWAIVVDVLTFYQERIANEGYLRTATERVSLIQLAGAVGYQIDPGLAATTALAFVVEDAPGTPGRADVPVGTQVHSVPAQGQLPQVFETTAAIKARAEWNALRPQREQPQRLAQGGSTVFTSTLTLSSTSLALQQGALLWVAGQHAAVHVAQASVDLVAGSTTVQLFDNESVQLAVNPSLPTAGAVVSSGLQLALTPYNVQKYILGCLWQAPDLDAFLREVGWDPDAVSELVAAATAPTGGDTVTAFGQQLGFFGRNTPNPSPPDATSFKTIWESDAPPYVLLERQVQGIATGSTVVFVDTTPVTALPPTGYTVTAVADKLVWPPSPPAASPTSPSPPPPPSIQVTGLVVTNAGGPGFPVVGTLAYVQSRPLPLAPTVPLPDKDLDGSSVRLDHMALGLMPGQLVALTGQRKDTGVTQTEVLTLSTVEHAGGYTTLTFTTALTSKYAIASVTLNANVAPATHGETVAGEVLGSGDGSQQNQTFVLAKPNLTYVPADAESGSADTLSVRVNGVLWQEVPSLFGQGGQSRSYAIRTDDQGKTSVIFGDGEAGARIPTGQENVTATYRTGLGPAGNVEAGALMLLFNRPLGIRSVQNPVAASGGVASQALDDARASAPLPVRTLGRIVTLSDYADFATGFPGVGKAEATLLESLGNPVAHLTVAADGGVPLADPSAIAFVASIQSAVGAIADPSQEWRVDLCNTRYFKVRAALVIQGGAVASAVIAAAVRALEGAFGFAARRFAQSVHAAEVIVTLQGVPGVLGVELDPLAFTKGTGAGSVLVANPARWDPDKPGQTLGADLILVSPTAIALRSQP